ncbi:putative immunity protein [Haladaptatus sp. CMAA 1911]|uniref:putative immunity protein n=1 Tax=unclassified Haladaptatus TaxID=2622732 RepID=UPI003754FD7B
MALPERWKMGPEWDGYNSVDEETQKALALWAADCAEHVLHHFEKERPDDPRPRKAIEAARAWTRGEVTVGEAVDISRETHAAAREATDTATREAARAAGHAIATAHVDAHSRGAAIYAIKAVIDANPTDTDAEDTEVEWQSEQLSEQLQFVVIANED